MSRRRLGSLLTLSAMVLILGPATAQAQAQPFPGTQSCDKGLVQAALAARRTTGPTAERDVFLRELARLRPDVGGAVVCLQFPTEQLLLRRNPRRDGTDFPIELMQLTIAANETLSLGRYVQWLSQVEVERTHSKGWTISFPGRIDALIRTSLAVDTVREAPERYQVALAGEVVPPYARISQSYLDYGNPDADWTYYSLVIRPTRIMIVDMRTGSIQGEVNLVSCPGAGASVPVFRAAC